MTTSNDRTVATMMFLVSGVIPYDPAVLLYLMRAGRGFRSLLRVLMTGFLSGCLPKGAQKFFLKGCERHSERLPPGMDDIVIPRLCRKSLQQTQRFLDAAPDPVALDGAAGSGCARRRRRSASRWQSLPAAGAASWRARAVLAACVLAQARKQRCLAQFRGSSARERIAG